MSATLQSFFEKNSSKLTKLRLSGDLIDGADAWEYLVLTPHLLELKLDTKSLSDLEVRSLIGSHKDEICPGLNVLDLYVHGPCKISVDGLVQALQLRFGKNKSMTIRFQIGCDATHGKQLVSDARINKLEEDYKFTMAYHEIEGGPEPALMMDYGSEEEYHSDEDSDPPSDEDYSSEEY